jgi:peptidoglycan hydrolase-like protein with peptidoglycan-binding domain
MGQKLFEIAMAGAVTAAAALFVLFEESGPARQLSDQWLREGGVADWASRLVAETVAGPAAAELAAQAATPTVLSHPGAATWMVVGNLALPEAGGGLTRHTYRVVVQRLCDQVAERACWRIDELELDGGPVAIEETAPAAIRAAAATSPAPAAEPATDRPTAGTIAAAPVTASGAAGESPGAAAPRAAAQPPFKPAPAHEVVATAAAALAAAGTPAVKPAPESPSAPPAEAAAEATAVGAAAGTGTADDGNTLLQQAALPPGDTAEPDALEADSMAAGNSPDDGAEAGAAEPLYIWADPKLLIPIQHQLTARGFEIGGIDGILGPRTREAIKSYQSQHGLPVDGRVSAALLRHMTGRATAAAAPPPASGTVPPPPLLGAASGATPGDGVELVRRIQQRLQQLGYVVDKPAGTMGSYTREAISTYQWRYGLAVDGRPSAALLTHLERQVGG